MHGVIDHAGVLRHQLLATRVLILTFSLVDFDPRGFQRPGKLGIFEMAVVPRIALAAVKNRRELVVNGWAVAPVDSAKRLLEPDVIPITVARNPLEVEVDACLGQRFLENLAGVSGA